MTNLMIYSILLLTLFFLISWLFIALIVYFIPSIVAAIRKHSNISTIVILNIVLGWTFLGWLAALLWSLNSDIDTDENTEEND